MIDAKTVAVAAVFVMSLGCAPMERLPAAGLLYLTSQPVEATQSFRAELRDDTGELDASIDISRGQRVVSQTAALPGDYMLFISLGCALALNI